MSMKQNLNDEQAAGAKKEMGGFHHPIFVVTLKPQPILRDMSKAAPPFNSQTDALSQAGAVPYTNGVTPTRVGESNGHSPAALISPDHPALKPRTLYIEAERWIDARAFALRKLGVSEAIVQQRDPDDETRPVPRWQVRYAGSAAGANTLRMQAREIQNEPTRDQAEHGWRDVREL